MSFLQNLGRSNAVENLTLTTLGSDAVQTVFSIFDSETISDVVIQNLTNYGCYLLFGVSAVTATDNDLYLSGGASISLANSAFIHFSIIRAVSNNASIRITGIGKSKGGLA